MVDSSQMRMKNGTKGQGEVLAELSCEGVGVFHVKGQRCIVGRCQQTAHMAISNSNLVSRRHIEVGPKDFGQFF
jgi:hypothetical protein